MITNCELPLNMLKDNNRLNDYDFILYHLMDECEEYRIYFMKQKKDRISILDNSAYEFFIKGKELDWDRFYYAKEILNPTFFILPDTLMDMNKTLESVEKFINLYKDSKDNGIAVVQGNSKEELIYCAKRYKELGINKIAIPFHNSFFKEMGWYVDEDITMEFVKEYGSYMTEDHLYAMGRVQFMRDYKDVFNHDNFVWIHMLGSHCPLEKKFYREMDSMDTGYPVKCAIVGHSLGREPMKPNIIIDEFLNKKLDKKTKELIRDNIKVFKGY